MQATAIDPFWSGRLGIAHALAGRKDEALASVCSSLNIDKEGLERFILTVVREQFLSSDFQDRLQRALEVAVESILPDADQRRESLRVSLNDCEKKIAALVSLAEAGVDLQSVAGRIKSLQEQKREITDALNNLQAETSRREEVFEFAQLARDFVEGFGRLSLADQKVGMKMLVKQVIVDRE